MQDLTPKQTTVIAALLAGKSIEAAATDAKVNASTIHRWMRDSDAFNAALADGRRAALHGAVNVLSFVARSATQTVIDIMADKRAPAGIRLRAALGVLEMLLKWSEMQDLDTRLKRLEAHAYGAATNNESH